ncbi:MAG: hypothetical protein A7316_02510 [Candidatus Altiarchaeales archaeon WOR_SM1_86-2]|nr:MAG: hypothetical protein A7316_02510 [Candidatus Altiarchaeales archaeon WOR_SM1_86-2]ODS40254.1 MAG: hypothetical protein A7315_09090 [Candidatus Altiarchaeales archaeon WOR_SM1_79]
MEILFLFLNSHIIKNISAKINDKMKLKLTLILVFIIVGNTVMAESVLVETFTRDVCPICQAADGALEELEREYDDVILLEYHLRDSLENKKTNERRDFYGGYGLCGYYLYTFFNGENEICGGSESIDENYKKFKPVIEKELRKEGDIKINANAFIDGDLKFNILIKNSGGEKDLKLYLVVVEDHVYESSKFPDFMNVARDYISEDFYLEDGYNVNFTYPIKKLNNKENSKFVIFAQATDKRVPDAVSIGWGDVGKGWLRNISDFLVNISSPNITESNITEPNITESNIISNTTTNITPPTRNVTVLSNEICVFFFTETCEHCTEMDFFLEEMNETYNLDIHAFIMTNPEDAALFTKYKSAYDIPDLARFPIMIINDSYYTSENMGDARKVITDLSGTGCTYLIVEKEKEDKALTIIIAMIVLGALGDAVNVCALAVMIILITVAISKFHDPKKMLYLGLSFIAAIYIVYLLTGLGLFTVLKEWLASSGASVMFKRVVGVVAIILGILNIKDYIKPHAGGFAMEVPLSWRPRMKRIIGGVTSIHGAFIAGLVVSLFLTPCVGTIYAAIIGMLSTTGVTYLQGIMLLILYNFIFVLPMLLILVLIYRGVKSAKEVESWKERNIRRMHLIAGIAIIIVGVVLLSGMI